MKILFWDVETAPRLAYVWQLRQDYINPEAVINDTFMLSWSAKWYGHKTVHSQVLTKEEALAQDDTRIVEALADMYREADIVVAHNGDRFDFPILNTRVLAAGLEPLPRIRSIDTLKIARKSFRFASNKLDYLAAALGLEGKHHTTFELWKKCYHGDTKALRQMSRYCAQDVVLLEEVFDRLRPYAERLPRMVESEHGCPFCGSDDLHRRGYQYTNVSKFQRWQCQACERWSRSRASESMKPRFTP